MDLNNYIYGKNSVLEALKTNARKINKLFILKNSSKDMKIDEIVKLAKENKIVFQFVPKEKFKDFSSFPHQGVLAMVSPVEYTDFYDFLERQDDSLYKKVIILDGVEDPHNLGAIIRTAVCSGFDAVIIPSRRSAQLSAVVEKTSAGAINHIPVIQVNSLSSTIDKLKDNNYWIIAAEAEGKDNYFEIDYTNMNFAIIMGGEETGVSKSNLKKADFFVKIPMIRDFNSLNVSNAAAVIMYESLKQNLVANPKK